MKYIDSDNIALILLTLIPFTLLGGVIAADYWNNQQVRMMYQQAYAKNMECRMSLNKSGEPQYIDKVCGTIPKFEDYNE